MTRPKIFYTFSINLPNEHASFLREEADKLERKYKKRVSIEDVVYILIEQHRYNRFIQEEANLKEQLARELAQGEW